MREIIDPAAEAAKKEAAPAAANVDDEVAPEEKPKKKTKKQAKMSAFLNTEVPVAEDDSGTENKGENTLKKSFAIVKEVPLGTVSVEDVLYHLPDSRFNGEGRWLQMETPGFYLINTYVPNSGQNLERLDYRVDEW